jgi:hypothetical protein
MKRSAFLREKSFSSMHIFVGSSWWTEGGLQRVVNGRCDPQSDRQC